MNEKITPGRIVYYFDCDELLVPTMFSFRKFVFENYNVEIPEEILDFENIEVEINRTKEEMSLWWSTFNTTDYLNKNKVSPNHDLLNFIWDRSRRGYESNIITSRPEYECRENTEYWVREHFGNAITHIYHCNSYSRNTAVRKRKKSEAIQELLNDNDFFLFAEDTHTHAIDVAESHPDNSMVYLLEKPWNRKREIPMLDNLVRVSNEKQMIAHMRSFHSKI